MHYSSGPKKKLDPGLPFLQGLPLTSYKPEIVSENQTVIKDLLLSSYSQAAEYLSSMTSTHFDFAVSLFREAKARVPQVVKDPKIIQAHYEQKIRRLFDQAYFLDESQKESIENRLINVSSMLDGYLQGESVGIDNIAEECRLIHNSIVMFQMIDAMEASARDMLGKYFSEVERYVPSFDGENLFLQLESDIVAALYLEGDALSSVLDVVHGKTKSLNGFLKIAHKKRRLKKLFVAFSHPEVQAGNFPLQGYHNQNGDELSVVSDEDLNSAPFQKAVMSAYVSNSANFSYGDVGWLDTGYETQVLYGIGLGEDPFGELEGITSEYKAKIDLFSPILKQLLKPKYEMPDGIRDCSECSLKELYEARNAVDMTYLIIHRDGEGSDEYQAIVYDFRSELQRLKVDLEEISRELGGLDPLVFGLMIWGRDNNHLEFSKGNISAIISGEPHLKEEVEKYIRSLLGGEKTVAEFDYDSIAYYDNQDKVGCTDQCGEGEDEIISMYESGQINDLLSHFSPEEEVYPGDWLDSAAQLIYKVKLFKFKYELAKKLVELRDNGEVQTQEEWDLALIAAFYINSLPLLSLRNIEDVEKIFEGEPLEINSSFGSRSQLQEAVSYEVDLLKSIKTELKDTGHGTFTFNFFAGDYHISTGALEKLINEFIAVGELANTDLNGAIIKYNQLKTSPLAKTVAARYEDMQDGEFYRHLGIGAIVTAAVLPFALYVGAGMEAAGYGSWACLGGEAGTFVVGDVIGYKLLDDQPILPGNGFLDNAGIYAERFGFAALGLKFFKGTQRLADRYVNRALYRVAVNRVGLGSVKGSLSVAQVKSVLAEMPAIAKSFGFHMGRTGLSLGSLFGSFTAFDYGMTVYESAKEGNFQPGEDLLHAISPRALLKRSYTIAALMVGGIFGKPFIRPLRAKTLEARLGEKFADLEVVEARAKKAFDEYQAIIEKAERTHDVSSELEAYGRKYINAAEEYVAMQERMFREFPDVVDFGVVELNKAHLAEAAMLLEKAAAWAEVTGYGNQYGVHVLLMPGDGQIAYTYYVQKSEALEMKLRETFGDDAVEVNSDQSNTFTVYPPNGKMITFYPLQTRAPGGLLEPNIRTGDRRTPLDARQDCSAEADTIVGYISSVISDIKQGIPVNAERVNYILGVVEKFLSQRERLTSEFNEIDFLLGKVVEELAKDPEYWKMRDRKHELGNQFHILNFLELVKMVIADGDYVTAGQYLDRVMTIDLRPGGDVTGKVLMYGKRYGVDVKVSHDVRYGLNDVPEWMSPIIENIISNAAKHTPEGQKPTVEVGYRDGVLSFHNTGEPIPPEVAAKIRVGEQVHGDASKPGTGEGLSIAKRVVESEGGKMWFDPGEAATKTGPTFYIELPNTQGKTAAEAWGSMSSDAKAQVARAVGDSEVEIGERVAEGDGWEYFVGKAGGGFKNAAAAVFGNLEMLAGDLQADPTFDFRADSFYDIPVLNRDIGVMREILDVFAKTSELQLIFAERVIAKTPNCRDVFQAISEPIHDPSMARPDIMATWEPYFPVVEAE